jgi:hypothetical protein
MKTYSKRLQNVTCITVSIVDEFHTGRLFQQQNTLHFASSFIIFKSGLRKMWKTVTIGPLYKLRRNWPAGQLFNMMQTGFFPMPPFRPIELWACYLSKPASMSQHECYNRKHAMSCTSKAVYQSADATHSVFKMGVKKYIVHQPACMSSSRLLRMSHYI